MSWRMGLVVAMAALAVTACGKKATTDEAASSDATQAGGAQGVAVGEPNPAAPTSVVLNSGTPVDGDVTMTAPPTAPVSGMIDVTWAGPANAQDYIDIVRAGHTETRGEVSYTYIREGLGLTRVRAPAAPGEYAVRYVLDLGSSRIVKATSPLTVTDAGATLSAPARAESGEPLSIVWTGPNADGDYLDIVRAGATQTSGEITYAYTRDGSPASIKAPGAAGDYDIRYLLEGPGGRRILATSRLTVTAATATLNAPATANIGKDFRVEWTGPARAGDYVDLVKKGHAQTSGEIDYFYVDRAGDQTLTAPQQAGEYELRYVLEAPGGRQVLARSVLQVK